MSVPDDMVAVLAKLQKKFGVTVKEAVLPSDSNAAQGEDGSNKAPAPKAPAPKSDAPAAPAPAKPATDKSSKSKAAASELART